MMTMHGNFTRILDSGNAYNYSVAKNEGDPDDEQYDISYTVENVP